MILVIPEGSLSSLQTKNTDKRHELLSIIPHILEEIMFEIAYLLLFSEKRCATNVPGILIYYQPDPSLKYCLWQMVQASQHHCEDVEHTSTDFYIEITFSYCWLKYSLLCRELVFIQACKNI